jgi:putative endonuclease
MPQTESARKKGYRAEDLAARFLEEKGFRILEKNWYAGRLEVDLIAADSRHILFVEVKSRASDRFGLPLESVNSAKRKSIVRAADIYLHRHAPAQEPRFDIISILTSQSPPAIEHYEAAFFPCS